MNTHAAIYIKKTNNYFLYFLLLHVPVLSALASLFGAPILQTFLIAGAICVGPALMFNNGNTHPRAVVHGIAVMAMSALLISISGGMVEMHFHIFASLAIMIALVSWVGLIAATLVIAVHHVAFYFLLPTNLLNYDAPFWVVLVHAGFVIMLVAPNCLLCHRLLIFVKNEGLAKTTLDQTANNIASLTANLVGNSQAVAHSCSEQERNLAESSAALTKISANTREVLNHSKEANELISDTNIGAQEGTKRSQEIATQINTSLDTLG